MSLTALLRPITAGQRSEYVHRAETLGVAAGKSGADYVLDGNTDRGLYHKLLLGIMDGDPAVLDQFPGPDLSGEWADETSASDVLDAATEGAPVNDETRTDILDAYEDAWRSACVAEIERVCRYHLADA
jgi:hypothetical protein